MALFKISKGNKTNLPTKLTEGYAYFCEDTHEFYIDHHDPDKPNDETAVKRSLIRAEATNIYWHNHDSITTNGNVVSELGETLEADGLHIHNIPDQETYDAMLEQKLIYSNHLYMIDGADTTVKFIEQNLDEIQKKQARENIGALGRDDASKIKIEQNDTRSLIDNNTTKLYVLGAFEPSDLADTLKFDSEVYVDTEYSVLMGAAWNDYAEYRICKEFPKAGRVVCENGDDTLSLATKRLQSGANIVSDTFGFAIGKTNEAQTPIAVSGRVLAYTYENREEFVAGDPVCAGPNGTVSKMSRVEVQEYPDRMIGTVSAIPIYDLWGEKGVKVDNRIWIKVR